MNKKRAVVRKEFVDKSTTLLISAFGLVAALAWNDTIKLFISETLGKPDSVWSALIYALIVTGLAVVVTVYLSKIDEK